MSAQFEIENVQSNMIAKLECFSDQCHIARPAWPRAVIPDSHDPLCLTLKRLPLLFLKIPTPRLLNFFRKSESPVYSDPLHLLGA